MILTVTIFGLNSKSVQCVMLQAN